MCMLWYNVRNLVLNSINCMISIGRVLIAYSVREFWMDEVIWLIAISMSSRFEISGIFLVWC